MAEIVDNEMLFDADLPIEINTLIEWYVQARLSVPTASEEEWSADELASPQSGFDTRRLQAFYKKCTRRDYSIKDNEHLPLMLCSAILAKSTAPLLHQWMRLVVNAIQILRKNHTSPRVEAGLCRFFRRIAVNPSQYSELIDRLDYPGETLQTGFDGLKNLQSSWNTVLFNTSNLEPAQYINLIEGAVAGFRAALRLSSSPGPLVQTLPPHQDDLSDAKDADDQAISDKDLAAWFNSRGSLKHLAKREHHFPMDLNFLTISTLRRLSHYLFDEVESGSVVAAILLLTLLTGGKVEFWQAQAGKLKAGKHKAIGINTKKQMAFLSRPYSLTDKVDEKFREYYKEASPENNSIPLPYGIILLLLHSQAPVTDRSIKDYLTALKTTQNFPLLSASRLGRGLYLTLKRHVADRVVADILCGTPIKQSPAMNYSIYPQRTLLAYYREAVLLMTGRPIESMPHLQAGQSSETLIGSKTQMKRELASSYLNQLAKQVEGERDPGVKIRLHTIWIWHVHLLLTAARVVSDLPGLPEELDLEAGLWWVSDKESRPSASYGRFIPLCDFLVDVLTDYQTHLTKTLRRFSRSSANAAEYYDEYTLGNRPFFAMFDLDHDWKPVHHEHLKTFNADIFPQPKNWTRQLPRSFLIQEGCPAHLIDALFGHEADYAEFLNPYSSASLSDLEIIRNHMQDFSVFLNLSKPVIPHV